MRERYLEGFDRVWIDSLNGDKYKTGKLTPEGRPDPSIFSTETNREGIQVGTAVALLVRKRDHHPTRAVAFRNLWGQGKRGELLADDADMSRAVYQQVTPAAGLGLPFVPLRSEAGYLAWPLLPELFPTSFPGVKTSRDDVVVDTDRDRLVRRMEQYFDPATGDEEMRRIAPGAMESTVRFKAEAVRAQLRKRGFLPDSIVRYAYRPFDVRWLYWEPATKLLDEKREEYVPHVFEGNVWIEARQKQTMERFDRGYFVRHLADNFGNGLSNFFPLYLATSMEPASLFDMDTDKPAGPRPNLSAMASEYVARLDATAEDLFYHALAVLHAPLYREENAGALRQDWPRVPLPEDREALLASAELGRQVAGLLDTEREAPGVAARAGAVRPELRRIGPVARAGGGSLGADDLSVTAGWGHGGNGRAVMPARGRTVERAYTVEEREAMTEGAGALGLTPEDAARLLGEDMYDIYLNDVAYWRNVPARVWDYTIGGYQVLKKWLSYRERGVLGRALTPDEAREVTAMARRIAAILLLEPRLDTGYAATKEATLRV